MADLIARALDRFGLRGAETRFVAARENRIYRVTAPEGSFALRLHRQADSNEVALLSELEWMAALSAHGLPLPRPLLGRDGAPLQVIEGICIDLLTWLEGAPRPLDGLTPGAREGHMRHLGALLARLHRESDAWQPPPAFQRPAWDRDAMVGESPAWGRFWAAPGLAPQARQALSALRTRADRRLAGASLDWGLIHGDPRSVNVLASADKLQLIDFGRGGPGPRLLDLATALLEAVGAADFAALRGALLEGYAALRPIDVKELDLFLALAAAGSLSRPSEEAAVQERRLERALSLAEGL